MSEYVARSDLLERPLTELLREGTVRFKIDEKYPQAMGISSIGNYVSIFGNSHWEILSIDTKHGTPFFSSDFPVALEFINVNAPINRIVPLTPDLAVRIIPDMRLSGAPLDFSFAGLRTRQRQLTRQEAIEINKLIVRSAEELVFFRDDLPWVAAFVEKNSKFRIEPLDYQIPNEGGSLQISTMRIRPFDRNVSGGPTTS
jgi:hypothetical protein